MPKHVARELSIAVTIIEWLLHNIILIYLFILQFMDMICVVAYLWCVS